jgi:hypothetical protein
MTVKCTEAREAMLVADLGELRGEGETLLAAHLSGCAACRTIASAIADDTARVAALWAVRQRAATRRLGRRFALLASLPIAAAAVIAVGLIARHDTQVAPPARVASLPVVRHVSLDVAPGQRATVIKTADPAVTVIWLSSGEGK